MSLQSAPVRQSQSTGPGGWTGQSGGGGGDCGKRWRRRRWRRQKLPLLCEPARGRGRGRRRWGRGRRSRAGGTLGFLGSCEWGPFQRQAESRQGLPVSGCRGNEPRKPGAAGLGGQVERPTVRRWRGTLLPGMEVRTEMDEESGGGVGWRNGGACAIQSGLYSGLNIPLLWCKPH